MNESMTNESISSEDNCLQNAINDSLDYQGIKKDLQKISEVKPEQNLTILISITGKA